LSLGARLSQLRHQFQDGTIRRIMRDAGLTTFSALVSAALNLVRSAILARYLGVYDFGRMAIVLAATMLVRQLVSIRAWEWTTVELSRAYIARDRDAAGSAMRASYFLSAAQSVVAFVITVGLAAFFTSALVDEPGLELLLQINAILLLSMWGDDSSFAAMRVLGRFRFLAGYGMYASALRLAALLPVIYYDGRLAAVLAVTAGTQACCGFTLLMVTRSALRRAFGGPLGGRLGDVLRQWRRHVKMLAVLSATDTVKTLSSETDPLIIGHFRSPEAVAPYRAAFQIVTGVHQLAVPLYMVFYPEMTKIAAKGDAAALRRLVKQTALFGAAVALVIGGALCLAAPLVVRTLYGKAYDAAALDLRVMSWSLLLLMVQWANPLFVSLGRTVWTLLMVGVMLVVKATLMLLLVPHLGHFGAAIAYTACFASAIPTAVLLAQQARPLLAEMARRGVRGAPPVAGS
jgi:O-antigen/teichoic acid export membrane protein